jgi:hypothetical protein
MDLQNYSSGQTSNIAEEVSQTGQEAKARHNGSSNRLS